MSKTRKNVKSSTVKPMTANIDYFLNSYEMLLKSAQKITNVILMDPSALVRLCRILKDHQKSTIHITGMGRSGKVGMIFGHMLSDIGFDVSIIGSSLAKPVFAEDVVVAFSGSGWTKTTCNNISDCIKQKAFIGSFTGDANALLARMSDASILIPNMDSALKESTFSYQIRKIEGEVASPLTPMGTIFELTSMFVSFGIFGALQSDSFVQGFTESTTEILTNAAKTLKQFSQNIDSINDMITLMTSCHATREQSSIFVVGAGVNTIISEMTSMRFQHLGLNIRDIHDWRFRKANDVLLGISGSGETSAVLAYLKDAQASHMRTAAITSFEESSAMKMTTQGIVIPGRETNEPNSGKPLTEVSQKFRPSFEFIAAITLDAIVAQIAKNLNITETFMQKRHANVE